MGNSSWQGRGLVKTLVSFAFNGAPADRNATQVGQQREEAPFVISQTERREGSAASVPNPLVPPSSPTTGTTGQKKFSERKHINIYHLYSLVH